VRDNGIITSLRLVGSDNALALPILTGLKDNRSVKSLALMVGSYDFDYSLTESGQEKSRIVALVLMIMVVAPDFFAAVRVVLRRTAFAKTETTFGSFCQVSSNDQSVVSRCASSSSSSHKDQPE